MPSGADWREFAQWAGVGILSMWSTWTLLRQGWILLVVAIGWAVALAAKSDPGRSGWGFVAGLGAVPLWIGIANRSTGGPLDPAWWLVSGAVTLAAALLLFLRPARSARDSGDVGPAG